MINCYTFQLSNIRPLAGEVLLEILEERVTAGGIRLPETFSQFVQDGQDTRLPDPPQALQAIVRKIGPTNGQAPEFVLGDRVILDRRSGRTINQAPRVLRLAKVRDVLAKFV